MGAASFWNVPKKCRPHGELFFLIEKERTIHEKVVVSERDTEDGSTLSDEEGERNAENSMLCSFAHHAGSPLQNHLSRGRAVQGRVPLSGASEACGFSDWLSVLGNCLQHLKASPIKEGRGEDRHGRQVQVPLLP